MQKIIMALAFNVITFGIGIFIKKYTYFFETGYNAIGYVYLIGFVTCLILTLQ